jgi:hypothetical protein
MLRPRLYIEALDIRKLCAHPTQYINLLCINVVVVVVCVGPRKRAYCRLIVHTPCVFNVPTFTARRLHVTTMLEILAPKGGNCWARNVR